MQKKHINFIKKKLIPFILRENGKGFAMEDWKSQFTEEELEQLRLEGNDTWEGDGIERKIPSCGTVACIGGSIECLIAPNSRRSLSLKKLAKVIGITQGEARGLFYNWTGVNERYCWPAKYDKLFARRKTPLGKAKVAVALLKEICRTDGKCLENPNYIR